MKVLSVTSVIVLSILLSAMAQDKNEPSAENPAQCYGAPGVPGTPGRDGRDGRDAAMFAKGEHGEKGERGFSGAPGNAGSKGPAGVKGVKGEKGSPGVKGVGGNLGPRGPKGEMGLNGRKGEMGINGRKGDKGEQSCASCHSQPLELNWKQCVWRREDGTDTGVIQECPFKKQHGHTALQVAYAGNLRVLCPGSTCCSRWFFTFNDTECTGPMAIDGIVHMRNSNDNPLRHRQIEGYCENLPAGQVKIGFNIGICSGYSTANGYSGWNSVSRIMVAEMPPAQQ